MLEPQKKVGLCSPNVAAVKGLLITEEIKHKEQIANHNIQNKEKNGRVHIFYLWNTVIWARREKLDKEIKWLTSIFKSYNLSQGLKQ